MISVCIATKNGSRYVGEQLASILPQLGSADEVVITDDASTDTTVEVVESFRDHRIKLIKRDYSLGIVASFEQSLKVSKGDIIFLADQDDVWLPEKVTKLMKALEDSHLVVSDALLVDEFLNEMPAHVSMERKSQRGLVRNLLRNSYMGCCMAFKRPVLERALPFPKDIPMHDMWIGLIAEIYFTVEIVNDKLVLHRKHQNNASTTGLPTQLSLRKQFVNRYKTLKNLILHRAYAA